jgi:hypothetical protein
MSLTRRSRFSAVTSTSINGRITPGVGVSAAKDGPLAGDDSSGRPPPREEPTPAAVPGRTRDPVAEAGSAADSESADREGISEDEAIRSVAGRIPARDDSARSLEIIDRLLARLSADPFLRIGSINVFNDEISVDDGDFSIGGSSSYRSGDVRLTGATVVDFDEAYLNRYIGVFVRPAGFGRALEILRSQSLVILCGPQGTGRTAAALALLSSIAHRDQLHLITGSAVMADRRWRCGPHGTGFFASLSQADASIIDDLWLQRTAKLLTGAGNFLVIVTGEPAGALARVASRADFLCEELGVPDPMTILRRKAEVAVGPDRKTDLDSLLASDGIADLLVEDGSPAFASRVASLLAQALKDGKDPPQAMAELKNPVTRIRAWFARYDADNETDYRRLVLPITVSVLEDSSYLTISDAAVALYMRLFPDEEGPPPLRFRRELQDQQQWIELALPEEDASPWGDPSPELLRFRSPLLRAAVLQHAWTWLDGMRPALCDWLRELGRNPDIDVRARVAASVGLIATLDFSYALCNFIYPWAVSRSPATRTCAALALAVPGSSPRYAPRVWAILQQWAANAPQGPGNRLPWSAVEAAGSALGRGRPDYALTVLREVLERDEWDTVPAMVLAVLNLVEHGCLRQVLGALLEWSSREEVSAPAIKALLAFVFTARTGVTRPGGAPSAIDPSGGASGGETPATSGGGAASVRGSSPSSTLRRASRLTGTAVANRGNGDLGASSPPRAGSGAETTGTSPVAHSGGAAEARAWPVLLAEANENRQLIADLWGRALSAKAVRPLALDALHSWLELADEDETALGPVSRVITCIARLGGKHIARLEYYLSQWSSDPKRPLRSAQRVHAMIDSGA